MRLNATSLTSRSPRARGMFGRRPIVLLLVASLLASLGAVVPAASRTALGNGGPAPRTWTVGPGDATTSCGSVDFQVGVAGDGSDWAAIQAAVGAASTGDTIYLCNDTYDLTTGIDLSGSAATFVTFRGESTTGTIVDGGDRVQLFYGGPDVDVAFVGLTLQNGTANGLPSSSGGAVNARAVAVQGAVFRDNTAGTDGGAIESSGPVTITDGTFIGNEAESYGGAIDVNAALVVVRGGEFRGNRSNGYAGGAVWASYVADLAGVLFVDNTTGGVGGAVTAGRIVLVDGEFRGNSATSNGGAIYVYDEVSISDGTFEDNRGDSGGAIYTDGRVAVTDGSFIGNRAAANGGAIEALTVTSVGSVYQDNSCGTGGQNQDGGAINADFSVTSVGDEFVGNSAPANGGAIKSFGNGPGTVAVIGGTFTDNTAGSGGAIDTGASIAVEITGGSFARNRATLYGGGAVRAAESVTVDGADFTANTAAGGGGAIAAGLVKVTRGSYRDNSAGDGGAILASTVEVSGATFAGNSAVANNGAIGAGGPVTAVDSTFVDNTAGSSSGAIGSADTVTLRRSHFLRNRAINNDAGAVYAGSLVTIEATDMTSNSAANDGGAIYAFGGGTISGGAFTDNHAGHYGGALLAGGQISISDGVFSENSAGTYGGALTVIGGASVGIADGVFTDNTAGLDGGAMSLGAGPATITRGVYRRNVAGGSGGAVRAFAGLVVLGGEFRSNRADGVTSGEGGGAIYSSAGENQLEVSASTFVDNTAGGSGGAVYSANAGTFRDNTFRANRSLSAAYGEGGGAIGANRKYVYLMRNLFVGNYAAGDGGAVATLRSSDYESIISTNDTFLENTAGMTGGALRTGGANSNLVVSYDTFVDNSAGTGDHMSWDSSGGGLQFTARGSIFVGGDCVGSLNSLVGNLTDSGCAGTLVTRADLKLGALADNGGLTETIPLEVGSVAIDSIGGETGPCTGAATDQRGAPRPRLATCDTGAYEFQGPADRTTATRLAIYRDGVEVTSGAMLLPGDSVTVRGWVASDAPDITTGVVTLSYCVNADATPASCATGTAFTGATELSVTDGTSGSDGLGEVSVQTTLGGAGYYRLGARYRVAGGLILGSEATTGTPTFLVATPVALTWDATGGSVQTTGTVPLRAFARSTGVGAGSPVSSCPISFAVAAIDGSPVATFSATTGGTGLGATTATGLTTPGVYFVTITTGGVCAAAGPAWGVLTVGSTAAPAKGTLSAIGGGRHFLAGTTGDSVSFGLRVDSTSGAIAKGSKTIGYRTNARFIWVSSTGWRLTAATTGDFTTGVAGPFTKPSCSTFSASDGVAVGAALPSRGYVCGQLVFRGTLQQWSGGTWGAGTEVAFTARIADGGATRGVDNTDWFGLQLTGGAPSITSLRPLRIGTTATYLGRAFVY